ncbi:hypothetical protein [Synechococcus elongatus]|uniref:General secretion pathway protein GspH n=1 Tax=Synechococcus elongatus PCC 11802 TaxID=2283154 RepID=A0AAT9JSB1_SYNEL|nr:hypothetical protein [Synechococcus elongatus]QFZ92267.1 hypothetical protein EKO22_07760 [Synechococcus elongatus PCC 11802]
MSLALLVAAQLTCAAPSLMAQAPTTSPTAVDALNPVAPPDNTPRNQAFFLALNRAKNLARAAAEQANGGLNRYVAESKMYGSGSGTDYTYSNGFFTFQFVGGVPGWQPQGLPPTVESKISVSFDGKTVRIDYNGPIRSGTPTAQPTCTCPPTPESSLQK